MIAHLRLLALSLVVIVTFFINTSESLKKEDCEVCITVLERFSNSLSDDAKKDAKLIEKEFRNYCKTTKSKENRFCYYLGGLEESATGILGEMSKPLSWGMPADKVCEKLKKKDAQICELRYEEYIYCETEYCKAGVRDVPSEVIYKQIDLSTVDLKKLKVRDLKKILSDWDADCEGCIEKTDFIKRIEELKPLHMKTEL